MSPARPTDGGEKTMLRCAAETGEVVVRLVHSPFRVELLGEGPHGSTSNPNPGSISNPSPNPNPNPNPNPHPHPKPCPNPNPNPNPDPNPKPGPHGSTSSPVAVLNGRGRLMFESFRQQMTAGTEEPQP